MRVLAVHPRALLTSAAVCVLRPIGLKLDRLLLLHGMKKLLVKERVQELIEIFAVRKMRFDLSTPSMQ